jgi:Zn-dependent peptidase ImmA (M78 family)
MERAREHRFFEDTEWQADAFASALLMPATGMHRLESEFGTLTTTMLQRQYLVSNQSATYRLENYQQRRSQLVGRT